MGISKTQITNYLEMRYDYQSARNVLVNWRKTAKIKDDIDSFDDNHLRSLLDYLKENASDATRVHAAIERLILKSDSQPVYEEPQHFEEPAPVEEQAYQPEPEHYEEPAPVEEAPAEFIPEEQAPAEENAEAPAEAPAEENAEAPAENTSGKKKKKKH